MHRFQRIAGVLVSSCFAAPLHASASQATPPTTPVVGGRVATPAHGDSFASRVIADGTGVILSWIERDAVRADGQPAAARVCMARFADGAWSPRAVITEGTNLFANWADTPSVVRVDDGSLLASWLRSGAQGTYVYDAVVSRSTDDGRTWSLLGPLHNDGKPAEHGFVSSANVSKGGCEGLTRVTAFCWLDGRAMALPDASADAHGHDHASGDMTLRAARVAPTIERPTPPSEILDERVCECCPTDLAISAKGPIVVYRDRGEDGTRDVALVRWLGEGWSLPKKVGNDGWMLDGCPVNGPSMSAMMSEVVVAWWTGATEEGAVRMVRSRDAGATFEAVIDLDVDGSLGRVESLLLPSGDAIVFWYDLKEREATLVARRVRLDGTLGAVHELAKVPATRASGFPRAALNGSEVWITWTDVRKNDVHEEDVKHDDVRTVKLLRVPSDAL